MSYKDIATINKRLIMFFYSTGDYESEYGQSLDKFAEKIAVHHVDNEWGEPNVKYLSLMLESEIAVSKDALNQFRDRVEEYYENEKENASANRAYYSETRSHSNGQNRY